MHLLIYTIWVEDTAKAIINGLYKVVHWLSTAAKMCDIE